MVDINGTLIAQILNFFVLVLILAKFAYKPLLQIMEERKQRIENDLLQAQRAKEEAETLQADYAAQLQLARKEAQAIVEAAQKQAEAESQAQKAMQQIRAEGITLSVQVAEKLVKKDFSSADNVAFVEDTIAKLDSTTLRS